MCDTANVSRSFTQSEAARLIAVNPFEDILYVIAARADLGELFDIEHAVPVSVRMNEPFVRFFA